MERVPLDTRPSTVPMRRDDTAWWVWLVGPATVFSLALAGTVISVPGVALAVWWPAAGASAWFCLRVAPRHRAAALTMVFATTAIANVLSDRGPAASLVYGFANAIEVAVVVGLLTRRVRVAVRRAGFLPSSPRRFVLDSTAHALYFVLAAVAGAVVAGTIVGAVGVLALGPVDELAALFVAVSHASAILLIAPFALLPPALPSSARWSEIAAQSTLLAALVASTFSPLTNFPGGFLVFGLLTWALLRFSVRVVYPQALLTAVIVLLLTIIGEGAFVDRANTALETAAITVVFMLAIAVFTVLLASARYDSLSISLTMLDAARAQAHAQRERAAALAERLELERQRQDFIATTSHELRTPITSILGYGELLREAELPAPERDWVETVQRNATRLNLLVEDLLSLGRGPTHAAQRDVTVMEVRDLVDDVRATHAPIAEAARVALTVDAAAGIPVRVDRDDVVKVLGNLVSNAVKFTPAGGSVHVEATRDVGMATITVTDSGPGMSAATIAHAFDRFYRAPDAETQNTPGTGLGLAIARELAERNGGTVELTSPRGSGVRATLRLPLAA